MSVRIVVNTESLDQISSAMDKVLLDLHANSKVLEKAYTDLHTHSEGQYFLKIDSSFVTANGWGNQLVDQLYHSSEFVKKASAIFTAVDAATYKELEEILSNKEKIGVWVNSQFILQEDPNIPVLSPWEKLIKYPRTGLPWFKQIIFGRSSETISLDIQMDEASKQIKEIFDQSSANWDNMSLGERIQILKNIEEKMALLQGRSPADLVPTKLGPGLAGQFDLSTGEMRIDSQELLKTSLKEMIRTMMHEGRHAFQMHAYYNEYNRDDYANSDLWGINMGNNYTAYDPKNPVSLPMYLLNPTEQDAYSYANEIMNRMGL